MTESEAALVAAMAAIRWLPGAEVHAGPDVTLVAGGRPFESLNHVLRLDVTGSDAAIEARIDDIDAELRARESVPATWWIGPSTSPADLPRRLRARGFAEAEPEFGMVDRCRDRARTRRVGRGGHGHLGPGRIPRRHGRRVRLVE